MTTLEAEALRKRLAKFAALQNRRAQLNDTLNVITLDDPNGPCGQGPFTGNTRESRSIGYIKIYFTKTRGGSPETNMELYHLEGIEACDFSGWIQGKLRTQIKTIDEELAKL